MRLKPFCTRTLVFVATVASRDARAQTDSIGRVFRDGVTAVARSGRLSRLDSTRLTPGVRREIRVYVGFGLGAPDRLVRVWEDARGVHGRFGLFWFLQELRYANAAPGDDREMRDMMRKLDASIRAYADTALDCRAIMRRDVQVMARGVMNVCWLDERPDRISWAQVLARLDSVGVESIPAPVHPKRGFDGWAVLVEVRNRAGYRAYNYYMPDSSSTDASERAAARVAGTAFEAFQRRLAK
jgi:hypothetical protein